jgi:hypothetical protein
MTASSTERVWKTTLWSVAVLGLLGSLASVSVFGLQFAASVALGACLAFGNLWLIGRVVGAVLSGGPIGRYSGLFLLKFSVVSTGLYLLFDSRLVLGPALLLGLATLPVGIVISQVSSAGSLREG